MRHNLCGYLFPRKEKRNIALAASGQLLIGTAMRQTVVFPRAPLSPQVPTTSATHLQLSILVPSPCMCQLHCSAFRRHGAASASATSGAHVKRAGPHRADEGVFDIHVKRFREEEVVVRKNLENNLQSHRTVPKNTRDISRNHGDLRREERR